MRTISGGGGIYGPNGIEKILLNSYSRSRSSLLSKSLWSNMELARRGWPELRSLLFLHSKLYQDQVRCVFCHKLIQSRCLDQKGFNHSHFNALMCHVQYSIQPHPDL